MIEVFEGPAKEALRQFGIRSASLTLVAQAENVTFKAVDDSGYAYTLRFHRPGYNDLAELQSERAWTRALGRSGIAVPEPLRALDGRDYVETELPTLKQTRWVSLAHWVEGQILRPILQDEHALVDQLQKYYRELGTLIAAMHNQAASWSVPCNFRRRRLDADGLAGLNPLWGRFWDNDILTPTESALLADVRVDLHAMLASYGQDCARFGIIHADLHPGNVLVNGDGLAVIDFDDAAFGWHMFDLAVALHQCQDLEDFSQIYAACLEGYCGGRTVAEEDLLMIPVFLLMRGLSEIGWFADRPENTTPGEMVAMKDFVLEQCRAYRAGTLIPDIDAFRRRVSGSL